MTNKENELRSPSDFLDAENNNQPSPRYVLKTDSVYQLGALERADRNLRSHTASESDNNNIRWNDSKPLQLRNFSDVGTKSDIIVDQEKIFDNIDDALIDELTQAKPGKPNEITQRYVQNSNTIE